MPSIKIDPYSAEGRERLLNLTSDDVQALRSNPMLKVYGVMRQGSFWLFLLLAWATVMTILLAPTPASEAARFTQIKLGSLWLLAVPACLFVGLVMSATYHAPAQLLRPLKEVPRLWPDMHYAADGIPACKDYVEALTRVQREPLVADSEAVLALENEHKELRRTRDQNTAWQQMFGASGVAQPAASQGV